MPSAALRGCIHTAVLGSSILNYRTVISRHSVYISVTKKLFWIFGIIIDGCGDEIENRRGEYVSYMVGATTDIFSSIQIYF